MSLSDIEIKELFEFFTTLKSAEDFEKFFADLCTNSEIEAMAQRLKSAKLLLKGETYEQIIAKTDISSATLSRVSKCVKYGVGYKTYIKD
jgi:TrpR-related protein YerC/YecD